MDSADGLRSIEEIRQVKYRHLRCIDQKLWDEIGDTLTADAVLDYGTVAYGRPLEVRGRSGIAEFFRVKLGPDIVTAHTAGQPEIAIDPDGGTASGVWSSQDTVIATEHGIRINGAAFCFDRYRRERDGRWRIARTCSLRTHETMISLADLPSFRLT
ncbi:MAG TPA: nuclear transport factor 2 family protein [Streptosporangiaceae bacterium]|jgi:hypothetical protein